MEKIGAGPISVSGSHRQEEKGRGFWKQPSYPSKNTIAMAEAVLHRKGKAAAGNLGDQQRRQVQTGNRINESLGSRHKTSFQSRQTSGTRHVFQRLGGLQLSRIEEEGRLHGRYAESSQGESILGLIRSITF